MNDLDRLITAAERVSRVWRRGHDATNDTMRDAINELDWMVRDIKKRIAKDSTTVIHRPSPPLGLAGE
jgi:hypothetical protein